MQDYDNQQQEAILRCSLVLRVLRRSWKKFEGAGFEKIFITDARVHSAALDRQACHVRELRTVYQRLAKSSTSTRHRELTASLACMSEGKTHNSFALYSVTAAFVWPGTLQLCQDLAGIPR